MAVRKSTVTALPPSPYYQIHVAHTAAHRSSGMASRVVYASSAPPVVPMTAYLNALNAPPVTGRARWLILLQRAMATVLALSFLLLSLGRFGAQSFAPAAKAPPPSPKDTGAYWKQLLAPDLKVRSFAQAATGQIYALVTNDRWMTLWDLPAGNRTQLFTNHSNEHFTAAAYSPDQHLIVTGSTLPTLSFWDVATGTARLTLNAHKGTISTLVFSPDGKTLASGSADSDVRLWEVKTGKLIAGFDSHLSFVLALAFAHNGATLASAGAEPTIQLYERRADGTWENARSLLNSTTHVIALAFSPDGQTLAAANLAGEILLWDLRQGSLRANWALSREIAYGLAFSPNGEWLACGTSGGNVSVWSLGGKLQFERHGHEAAVRACAFSANGAQLISADVGTKFWQMSSGEVREAGNVAVQYWQMTEGEKQQLVHLTPYWIR
jgi:WD40 repeat protein